MAVSRNCLEGGRRRPTHDQYRFAAEVYTA